MKKLLFAALAIGAMAACTKSNVYYDRSGELTLSPVAQKATKAALDGTYYPTDAAYNFNVWAWWGNAAANTATDASVFTTSYIDEGTFEARNTLVWGGVTPYYWPTTGSLVFAGYSPASADAASFDYALATKTLTVSGYTQTNDISATKDLMWFDVTDASYDQNAAASGVPVVFKHALSWLTFGFNLKDGMTPENWRITDVKLTGIETKADFTAVKDGDAGWSTAVETEEVAVYAGIHGVTYTTDGTTLESTPGGVVVIPQSSRKGDAQLVVTYDLKIPASGDYIEGQTVILDLVHGDGDEWLPGKHYIYTIVFGANEILIAPTVTDWVTVNVEVPVQ